MPSSLNPTQASGSREVFDWLLLLRAPGLALRGRVLMLAAVGVLAVWTCDAVLLNSPATLPAAGESPWLDAARSSGERLTAAWRAMTEPFFALAEGENLLVHGIRGLWRIAVWGLLGGAIMRIAVLRLTRGEAPDPRGACIFAWRHKSALVGGPLLLVAGLVLLAMPLGLVRLAMQASRIAAVAAVLWPVVLLAAVAMAVYAIGLAIGWPLAWAAVAADKSDGFDAISRMFAYVYQQPLRLLGYLTVALGMGWLAGMAVELFLAATLYASGLTAGSGAPAWAASVIAWWESLLAAMARVFFTAYLWTAAAAIYLLRRLDIDGAHLDEVSIDDAEYSSTQLDFKPGSIGVPERVHKAA